METLLIQVTNQKALGLLHELEELNLIKVIKEDNNLDAKLSERFSGKLNLSDDEYNQFQKYIQDHTGWTNAYTSVENTNYHFEIDSGHFKKALDM